MAERGGDRGGFGRGFGGRRRDDRGRGRRRASEGAMKRRSGFHKEVATAIRGAIILAKLSVIPVRRGYWGNKIGKPHSVPCKVTGKCGSVTILMVPAPRGSGIFAARVPKKVLQFARIEDLFTSFRGSTKALGNFVKVRVSIT
ncbi:Ribosomal protein S5, C-terminal [Sesbania bispinosa]|nr:Ribosomal protein S5, C-terminal [Sesbania bispinosa]